MKSKTILAVAVAALFSSAAIAESVTERKGAYSPEATESLGTVHFRAAREGPILMPNPVSPGDLDTAEARRERANHLTDVNRANQARSGALYGDGGIGATRSEGGGFIGRPID